MDHLKAHQKVPPSGCQFEIQFVYDSRLNAYVVKKCYTYHNHQIGPTIAKHYPSSRRLITTECQGALNLLEVGGNTTLVHRELLCKRESRDTSAVAVFE